jgi:iron complex outermembrane receptor protein
VHHQEQDRVAIGETPTDAFTLLDAQVSYHWDTRTFGWEAYLKGSNLTDEDARLHTSFLKEKAPLMGRNLTAGLRVFF